MTTATTTTTTMLMEVRGLCVETPERRPLFRDLSVGIGRDRVALVGRNGVGKSTLLQILAGEAPVERGSLVRRTAPVLVRQDVDLEEVERAVRGLLERADEEPGFSRRLAREATEAGLRPISELVGTRPSRGEARKVLLLAAKLSDAELLLLDEPTEDLDEAGLAWLERWLGSWDRGAMVVSHHRALLRGFEHFFVVAESGCRYFAGTFEALERSLAEEGEARERQYVETLHVLEQQERRDEQIRRRRQRKKNVGRLHELDRCTSRMRLNQKRGYAQETQGKAAKIRAERIGAVRDWARATRRALAVSLPLELRGPVLGEPDGRELATLEGVGVSVDGRPLLSGIDLRVQRDRVAIVGPNGAGKTTLLRVLLGQQRPTTGKASCEIGRIGSIAQGATDWISDESLLGRMLDASPTSSFTEVAALLVEHKFPLALAERPLRSLSPGERVRAALLCLFQLAGTHGGVELLVLDEPTYSLDFVGIAALQRALRAWPGGLVIASHDRELLDGIGIETTLVLDGKGGHRFSAHTRARLDAPTKHPFVARTIRA
jgi:ATPase subunit of ABC transporter with duplicated ATPase domains